MNRLVVSADSPPTSNEKVICSQCRNILWKPVCCRKCTLIFCARCQPRQNFFKELVSLFKKVDTRSTTTGCDHRQGGPVPDDVLSELGKLRVRCAFAANGCQVISSYHDLQQHEMECEYENFPCEVCQLALSKRPPVVEHTLRICFEEMKRKDPAPIQQQFIKLLSVSEQMEEENRHLRAMIENLETRLTTLDFTCLKRPTASKN